MNPAIVGLSSGAEAPAPRKTTAGENFISEVLAILVERTFYRFGDLTG